MKFVKQNQKPDIPMWKKFFCFNTIGRATNIHPGLDIQIPDRIIGKS